MGKMEIMFLIVLALIFDALWDWIELHFDKN